MNRGYIKVWRRIVDNGIMQMPETFTLFMHILINATHKDMKSGMVEIKRGEFIGGRVQLSTSLKQSEQSVRTSLKRLEKMEMLTIKSTSKYSVYTIENYNEYQDSEAVSNQHSNQQVTSNQPASNQQSTTKQTHKHINTEEKYRGSRLPTTWNAPQEYIDYCLKERPDLNPDVIAMDFKDYWVALAGAKGLKLDWLATWRKWVRNQNAPKPKGQNDKSSKLDDWANEGELKVINA